MPRKRQPTDVVVANGRKHFSSAELEERRSREVKIGQSAARVYYPPGLPKEYRKEFKAYAEQLMALGENVYLNAKGSGDADALRDYVISENAFLQETERKRAALEDANVDEVTGWDRLADKDFRRARACAAAIGLTVSSRCKLVVPKAQEVEDDPMAELLDV